MLFRTAFILYLSLSLGAAAQEDFGLPAPLDAETQRRLLAETFPELDTEIPRLPALQKFGRDLELYRQAEIEGLRIRIGNNCRLALQAQRRINAAFDRGDLSVNERTNFQAQVDLELEQCLLENREGSLYWSIYDDFIRIYRESIEQNRTDVENCYRTPECRSGTV
jgi:hypothetical protein